MATNIYVVNPATDRVVWLHTFNEEIRPRTFVKISDDNSISDIINDSELIRSLSTGEVLVQVGANDAVYVPHPGGVWVTDLSEIASYLNAEELVALGGGGGGGGIGPPSEIIDGAPATGTSVVYYVDYVMLDDPDDPYSVVPNDIVPNTANLWFQVFPVTALGVGGENFPAVVSRGLTISHNGGAGDPDLIWILYNPAGAAPNIPGEFTHKNGRLSGGEVQTIEPLYINSSYLHVASASTDPAESNIPIRVWLWS